jgi:hypothetical protein
MRVAPVGMRRTRRPHNGNYGKLVIGCARHLPRWRSPPEQARTESRPLRPALLARGASVSSPLPSASAALRLPQQGHFVLAISF